MKNIQNILSVIVLLCLTNGFAQQSSVVQKEIDETLWKPFQKAFEALDGDALNNLYAKEVLRVTPAGIDTENAFKLANVERFKNNQAEGIEIQLDFWLDSRHTNEHTSYEVGFYRIRFKTKTGVNTAYGQFHIVLKKIEGAWKITQDWDTDVIAGVPISAKDFDKKPPLQF